jgi:cell division protease FtsH
MFLDTPSMPERGAYAEETARVIDVEVKRLVAEAETAARGILTTHRTTLDQLTERLLEKEVLEGDELREMLAAGATS